MKKKILVTGGAGFIFSNFIRKALYNKLNYQLATIDYCKSPNALNNIYSNRGHTFYVGDIADKHLMNVVFEVERPDIVIHAAAESFVDSAIADASSFVHSNVTGTQTVIDMCLKWKVERLIYISTDEVYGHLSSDADKSWTEDSPLAPRNPYSASKAAGELLVQAAHHTHGLPYNITRSCNNYGPRQQARNFIPKVIGSVLNQTKMPIYGQGMQSREWVHVEDNCDAIVTIIEQGKLNEIYNISSGHEFANIELFNEVCNIMKTEYQLDGHNLATFVADRPGHDFRYSVNSDKLRALGWKPNWKFKKGLENCVNWYKANAWWFR